MTKKTNKKLSLVQIARALAILFVLLGHANTLFYQNFQYQWFNMAQWGRTGGVDFFFIVSGFMIYYLYSKNIGVTGKAKDFLLKRVLRIFPMYWVFTLAALSMFFIFPQLGDGHETKPIVILKALVLVPGDPILVVTWSLSNIMLFYVLFTFLIYKPKLAKPLLAIWIAISLLTAFKTPGFSKLDGFLFNFNNMEIVCGSLVAHLILNFKIKFPKIILLSGFLLISSVWTNNVVNGTNETTYFYYCVAAMLIMLGISSIDLNKDIETPAPLQFLGDASYSIYISHGPLLQFYILLLKKLNVISIVGILPSMCIAITLSILSGCLVYIILEKPVSSFVKRKILDTKKKSIATSAA